MDLEAEDFQYLKKLGRGAFGSIYKAKNQKDGKIYAVKIYKKEEKEEDICALEDASFIAMKLKHPNLMECYTFFHDRIVTENSKLKGISTIHLFTILEFIPGKDLEKRIRELGKIEEKEVDVYLPQIISALKYLHSNKIIHRDFKPSNIMISPDDKIKIVDYDFLERNNKILTRRIGTPYYLAPDFFTEISYDERVDLWALGITLFYSLNGYLPYDAEDQKALKKLIVSDYEPKYSELPSKYRVICQGLLKKEPESRLSLEEVEEILTEDI